ncbi:MAG: hypothetical protein OXE17_01250 [Chloroflexi bacterium]|nr:hypothetical protein [Chloroflexota bacterium]
MLTCQLIELQPCQRQTAAFHRHAAAARIARNDLIARWREEGGRWYVSVRVEIEEAE